MKLEKVELNIEVETQYFPDSLNHKGFSNVILKAGEEYNHTTIYKVSIKNK